MLVSRFVTNDGRTLLGEAGGDGYANVLLDPRGVCINGQQRDAIRAMLQKRLTLVADDDPGIRQSVHETLNRVGGKSVICVNGSEALSVLSEQNIGLVVSDIVMPDHDGYEIFSAAKVLNPDLPVMLITGFGYDPGHQLVRATKQGLEGVLFKPFSPQQLLERVGEALRPIATCGGGAFVRTDERVRMKVVQAPLMPTSVFGLLDSGSINGPTLDQGSDDLRVYLKPPSCVQDPGKPLQAPQNRQRRLFGTGALAAVMAERIGPQNNLTPREALLGFTAALDVMVPHQADETSGWWDGQVFDVSCPLGPALLTTDALPDELSIVTRVNEEIRLSSRFHDVLGTFEKLIALLTTRVTLAAGSMVLWRGPGAAPATDHRNMELVSGDQVCVEVSGIGQLEVPIK